MIRIAVNFLCHDVKRFTEAALQWSGKYEFAAVLNSNNYSNYLYATYDVLIAVGNEQLNFISTADSFNQLKNYRSENDWMFGYLSYDLKNQVENITSSKKSLIAFPEILFFVPEIIITLKGNQLTIIAGKNHQELLDQILSTEKINQPNTHTAVIQHRTTKEKYLAQVESIKQQIMDGDFYELNYCIEFFAENVFVNPCQLYQSISNISPAPFAAFMKLKNKFIICSSPERFLKKENNKLISQPIKGTRRRITNDKTADQKLIDELIQSEKERAENLMIVDLVRNDLNRTAKTGTVKVEELCKIYTYPQVHQMISTITSELAQDINSIEALKLAFPMGSMTGAPKIEVMKAIDHYEDVRRGVYSGAIGYFAPEDNFDFNVVIRTILYNQSSGYLSFHAGAAITADSIAEEEYEECLIKAAAMIKVLE